MRYRRIFDLEVLHEYHVGSCPDLRIEPRTWHPSGTRALARHRLQIRLRPGGVEVVGPVDADDRPFISFADDLVLGFDVHVNNSDFVHYTDLDAWETLADAATPLYRGSAAAGRALQLGAAASPGPPAVAAGIEISGVAAEWLVQPPRFVLELQARQALWVFYLLTARANGQPPQIDDGEPGRGLAFKRELLASGHVSPTDDPVGHGLLARYPERRCFRMISDRPIACRRAPLRQLTLRRGDELLIRELPNPSILNHAILTVEPASPRAALFHVLEY